MKRLTFTISIIFLSMLILSSLSYVNGKNIYGCYKKVNGQLRIVNHPGRCLPSEVPISWNQEGPAGPQGPAGPRGPAGPAGLPGSPGMSVESISLPEGDPNCPFGGSLFKSISGVTYACNGGEGEGSSFIVRKIPTGQCTNGYGWCPDGFRKWAFKLQDAAVNENSVISINVLNPLINDGGCEIGKIITGEFEIHCTGDDYVGNGAVLHYAIFNQ